MLPHPLESASLLMRYRTEWLKGLRTEVTGSLGKEAASASPVASIKRKRCPGLWAQKKSSCAWLQLKAGGFPSTVLTAIGLRRQKAPDTKNWVSFECRGVRASLRASRGRAVLSTSLIWRLSSFSHSLRNDKDPVWVAPSQHLVSFNSSRSIIGEKSAIDLGFFEQNYTRIINSRTPLQQLWKRSSQWMFLPFLKIEFGSSITFHPSKESLC